MRPMGLLVILFDRELRCEVFQQITMGTPSYGGAGQQSRGMLVPGNSMVLSVQTSQEWFACIRMRPVIVNSPN